MKKALAFRKKKKKKKKKLWQNPDKEYNDRTKEEVKNTE